MSVCAGRLRIPATVTKADLERYFINRPNSFWGIKGKAFPNQLGWTNCMGFALEIQKKLGASRVKIYGFYHKDNPTAKSSEIAGGHDFAMVDDRFIVDPWLTDVMGASQGVFDVQTDQMEITRLYGNRNKWEVTNER